MKIGSLFMATHMILPSLAQESLKGKEAWEQAIYMYSYANSMNARQQAPTEELYVFPRHHRQRCSLKRVHSKDVRQSHQAQAVPFTMALLEIALFHTYAATNAIQEPHALRFLMYIVIVMHKVKIMCFIQHFVAARTRIAKL